MKLPKQGESRGGKREGKPKEGIGFFDFEIFYLVMSTNTYVWHFYNHLHVENNSMAKRIGHETDTVYVKSSPAICS